MAAVSPAAGIDQTFSDAAEHHQLDESLLTAIATLESGYGESELAKDKNNWFGWRCNDGSYMRFDSPEDGVWHVAETISSRPHGSIEDIAAWYNPANCEEWAGRVKEIQERNYEYDADG